MKFMKHKMIISKKENEKNHELNKFDKWFYFRYALNSQYKNMSIASLSNNKIRNKKLCSLNQ